MYLGWLLRRLTLHQDAPGVTVDLGCGNGTWTVVLARGARRIIAVDVSGDMLAECSRRLIEAGFQDRASFIESDLSQVELPPCDLVVAGAVVHYLSDAHLDGLLARIAKALPPGGLLYLRTTVSRSERTLTGTRASDHAIYRPMAWYDDRLRRLGFETLDVATATDFVPAEVARRVFGWLRALAYHPIRWGWRLLRWRKPTDVAAYLLRRR